MVRFLAVICAIAYVALYPITVVADTARVLSKLVGYTIADFRTVEGYVDSDGERKDGFEGCAFGRSIVFTDGTALKCNGFSYAYAYRPTAIILVKSMTIQGRSFGTVKMIVDNDVYDMESVFL
jgi:hypothetical protein